MHTGRGLSSLFHPRESFEQPKLYLAHTFQGIHARSATLLLVSYNSADHLGSKSTQRAKLLAPGQPESRENRRGQEQGTFQRHAHRDLCPSNMPRLLVHHIPVTLSNLNPFTDQPTDEARVPMVQSPLSDGLCCWR